MKIEHILHNKPTMNVGTYVSGQVNSCRKYSQQPTLFPLRKKKVFLTTLFKDFFKKHKK